MSSVLIFGLQTCAGVVVLGLIGAGLLVALNYIGGAPEPEAGVIMEQRND